MYEVIFSEIIDVVAHEVFHLVVHRWKTKAVNVTWYELSKRIATHREMENAVKDIVKDADKFMYEV
jgi:predicted SprT family Zn-dependent metalloprotease